MEPLDLVSRLAALRNLAGTPREELTWLVAHGDLEAHEAGSIIGPKGEPIRALWIILSGRIGVRVDRGAGPKRVITWGCGEVTGMLPYSRMTGPPGDNYLEEAGEVLTIHERLFPEMISRCPVFTAYTVHLMLDRARGFNASDLQDEKMISLGKLAAGLAHELNNPASAVMRGSERVVASLAAADEALRTLRAGGLEHDAFEAMERARSECDADQAYESLPPLQRADREDALAGWLTGKGLDPSLAGSLAETAVTMGALDDVARVMPAEKLDAAIQWIVANYSAHAIGANVGQAAGRIFRLVDAVKRFTYMDNLAGPEATEVEAGLRDTIDVLAAKASAKAATITLDIETNLPRVRASGAELNQVWFNLVDNALDAVSMSGHVAISARQAGNRVVVVVLDDGPGIPPSLISKIFDPFFTTKPPGHGVGLGLDISRRLIRRHQGELDVQSAPGRTTFEVSLPCLV